MQYPPEYRSVKRYEEYELPFVVNDDLVYDEDGLKELLMLRLTRTEGATNISFKRVGNTLTVSYTGLELIVYEDRHYDVTGWSEDYPDYYERCIREHDGQTSYWANLPDGGFQEAPPKVPGYEFYIHDDMWSVRHQSA